MSRLEYHSFKIFEQKQKGKTEMKSCSSIVEIKYDYGA